MDTSSHVETILKQSAGLVMLVGPDDLVYFYTVGLQAGAFLNGENATGKTIAELFPKGNMLSVADAYNQCVDSMKPIRTKIYLGFGEHQRVVEIRALTSDVDIIVMVRDITQECR